MSIKMAPKELSDAAQEAWDHVGECCGCANHDHDLIHELSRRLDALWRYDQFIANAEGHDKIQTCWRDFKKQEVENVMRLKQVMKDEIQTGCF